VNRLARPGGGPCVVVRHEAFREHPLDHVEHAPSLGDLLLQALAVQLQISVDDRRVGRLQHGAYLTQRHVLSQEHSRRLRVRAPHHPSSLF
jgi:hypothetical protein